MVVAARRDCECGCVGGRGRRRGGRVLGVQALRQRLFLVPIDAGGPTGWSGAMGLTAVRV